VKVKEGITIPVLSGKGMAPGARRYSEFFFKFSYKTGEGGKTARLRCFFYGVLMVSQAELRHF
jgi:hypothetical protein